MQQDNTNDPILEPEVKLPRGVLIARDMIVIPVTAGLILAGVFNLLSPRPWGPGSWVRAIALSIGLLLLARLVVLGRLWAYWVLVALLASSVLYDIIQVFIMRNHHTGDLWTPLILIALLSGYRQYKQFAASRRDARRRQ